MWLVLSAMSGNPCTVLAIIQYATSLQFFLQRKLTENPLRSTKDLSHCTTCILSGPQSPLYSLCEPHDLLLSVTLTLSMKHGSPIPSISLPFLPPPPPPPVNCVLSFPLSFAESLSTPPLSQIIYIRFVLCRLRSHAGEGL